MTMSRSTGARSPDVDGTTTARRPRTRAARTLPCTTASPGGGGSTGRRASVPRPARRLPGHDPHARELVISCGAALHHLQVALARRVGVFRVRRLPDPADPACLASVTLTGHLPVPADTAIANAIPLRRTDRRRFSPWPVPAELIGELTALADLRGLRLQAITEPLPRWRLFRAISDAAERQADDPAQAAELAMWSGRHRRLRTVCRRSTLRLPHPAPGPPPMRQFADPQLPRADSPRRPGGRHPCCCCPRPPTGRMLLAGSPARWRAGYCLTATRDGLASSVLSQPLEVGDTRAFLYEHVVRSSTMAPAAAAAPRMAADGNPAVATDPFAAPFGAAGGRATRTTDAGTCPRVDIAAGEARQPDRKGTQMEAKPG